MCIFAIKFCYIKIISIFILIDNWQWIDTPYKKLEYGKWELVIPPNSDGTCAIKHLSEIKVIVRKQNGELVDRLSPWAKYVVQPPENSSDTNYKQRAWHPPAHDVIFIFI